jgi:hypothetical protein
MLQLPSNCDGNPSCDNTLPVIFTLLVKYFTLAITRWQQNPRLAITFFSCWRQHVFWKKKMCWRVTLVWILPWSTRGRCAKSLVWAPKKKQKIHFLEKILTLGVIEL